MFLTKSRIATALLVAVATLAAAGGLIASRVPPAEAAVTARDGVPTPAVSQDPEAAPPAQPAPKEKGEMTVAGRVLGADGKPVADASVVVVARPRRQYRSGDPAADRTVLLAEGKADAEGRFRLQGPRTSSALFWEVYVAAGARGHALAWQRLSPDAAMSQAVLKLAPEQIIRGRLLDLQGVPAAGVKLSVAWVGGMVNGEPQTFSLAHLPARPLLWPEPVTTDAKGYFVLRGCHRDRGVQVQIRDERFAAQGFYLIRPGQPQPRREVMGIDPGGVLQRQVSGPDEKGQAQEPSFVLAPAQLLEGRVVYADTGKPAANARVLDVATGADGRFRLPLPGREVVGLAVFAPEGTPYLGVTHRVQWPQGAVKHEVEIRLPRGVLVRGKVTEAGTGKPVAGACVQFWPRGVDNPNLRPNVITGWQKRELTKADGSFAIAVLPGPAHLLVQGPTPDYVHEEIGHEVLYSGRPGGSRLYPDAVVKLDIPARGEPKELAVTLRRGVTVRGRLLGPDGQPVARAVVLHRLHIYMDLGWHFATEARDGTFAVHGLDPDKSIPVHFLDAEKRCGAVVHLWGKQAGEEVTVRLVPCGQATARYLDGSGKPLADYAVSPDIVITPGHPRIAGGRKEGEFLADQESLVNLDRHNYWDKVKTDAQGRVTFPALIPGATYRIGRWEKDRWLPHREFTVESGKTIDLGDVIIQRAK
jgi:protocatechuate 3,4-dioxygenase beta subunit